MSYKQLYTFEHTRIEIISKMGYSTRQIAGQLNRPHGAIARELKRNIQQTYLAELAEELAEQRRLVCHRKELKSEQLIQPIQKHLKLTWSPEQIFSTALKSFISFKTVYRWNDLNWRSELSKTKGKASKTSGNTGTI